MCAAVSVADENDPSRHSASRPDQVVLAASGIGPISRLPQSLVDSYDGDGWIVLPRELLWTDDQLTTLLAAVDQLHNEVAAPDYYTKQQQSLELSSACRVLRYYEDSAKRPSAPIASTTSGSAFTPIASDGIHSHIRSDDIADDRCRDPAGASALNASSRSQHAGGLCKHPDERVLQRIEYFLEASPALAGLLNNDRLLTMVSQLLKEPAILFKEKLNFKLPGGNGFSAHQDVAAGWWLYGQTTHLSVSIAIDAAHASNGALELVRGAHTLGMLSDPWQDLPAAVCDMLYWEMVCARPGDAVLFHSYTPHRSAPNLSDQSRRALYVTYARASEGDWRQRYFEDKRKGCPPE